MMCVLSIAVTHLLGAAFMLLLIYYPHFYHSAETAQHRAALEAGSETLAVTPALAQSLADDPCIICFDTFEAGQQARRLGPCGHLFHTECIDTWLERRLRSVPRISCPVCSAVIHDDLAPIDDSDPAVARDLAWLTELRRNHPGFFW